MTGFAHNTFPYCDTANTLKEIRQVGQVFDTVDGARPCSRKAQLRAFAIFLASQSHLLRRYPSDLIPIAYNHAATGPVADKATALAERRTGVWLAREDRPPASVLIPARLLTIPDAGSKVEISADAKIALSTSGSDVFVWDLKTGALLQSLADDADTISAIALSGDGRFAIFGKTKANNAAIVCCDVLSGAVVWQTEVQEGNFATVATSADGAIAAAIDSSSRLTVWDTASGRCLQTFPETRAFSLSGDGEKVARISNEGILSLDEVVLGNCLSTLSDVPSTITEVRMSMDGRLVVTVNGHILSVWDMAADSCIREIEVCDAGSRIEQLALTPDARIAFTIAGAKSGFAAKRSWSVPNKLEVWDTSSVSCVRTLTTGISDVAVSADGRVIASADGDLHIWNPISVDEQDWQKRDSLILSDVVVSPDFQSQMLLIFNSLRIEDAQTGEHKSVQGYSGDLTSAAWSPDGRLGITGAFDYDARVWDVKKAALLRSLKEGDYVNDVTFNVDGRLAICGSRSLDVWDLATGESKKSINLSAPPVTALAVSPDDKFVVAATADNDLSVWSLGTVAQEIEPDEWGYSDISADTPLVVIEGRAARVVSVALTPDGRRVISTSTDGCVNLWNLVSGEIIHELSGHSDLVRRVVVTPDGEMCVTASEDGTLRIWDLKNGACEYVYRTERKVISISAVRADGVLVCATTGETLRHLRLRGRKLREPLVTAIRLYRFAPYLEHLPDSLDFDRPLLQPGEILLGEFDSTITTRCLWCGQRSNVATSVLDAIQSIAHTMHLDEDASPCLNYPEEVWNEDRLVGKCTSCHYRIRFNPFLVSSVGDVP